MKVPWKIVGLAGLAGVAATTGVVVARKRRDQTEYDPDELRDKLHSRVAATESDEPLAEADTKIHTPPHGDPAAEATGQPPAPEATPAPPAAEAAPGDGDGAPHTSSAS
jgi:hypothetical protein